MKPQRILLLAPLLITLGVGCDTKGLSSTNPNSSPDPGPSAESTGSNGTDSLDPLLLIAELREASEAIAMLGAILGGGKPFSEAALHRNAGGATSNFRILASTTATQSYDALPNASNPWVSNLATVSFQVTKAWYEVDANPSMHVQIGNQTISGKNGEVLEQAVKRFEFYATPSHSGGWLANMSLGTLTVEDVQSSTIRPAGRYVTDRGYGESFKIPESSKSVVVTFTPESGGGSTVVEAFNSVPTADSNTRWTVRQGQLPTGSAFRTDLLHTNSSAGFREQASGRVELRGGRYMTFESLIEPVMDGQAKLTGFSDETRFVVRIYNAANVKHSELLLDRFTLDASTNVCATTGAFSLGSGQKASNFEGELVLGQSPTWTGNFLLPNGAKEPYSLEMVLQAMAPF